MIHQYAVILTKLFYLDSMMIYDFVIYIMSCISFYYFVLHRPFTMVLTLFYVMLDVLTRTHFSNRG